MNFVFEFVVNFLFIQNIYYNNFMCEKSERIISPEMYSLFVP